MLTAIFAALGAVAVTGTTVMAQVRRQNLRRERMKSLELRPNCLLTRHPIVFISGRKSLFRLFDHWNDVPSFLREHGYEILTLEPVPGKNASASILAAVESLPGKCHLIADSSSEDELTNIARMKHANVATLTVVRNGHPKKLTGTSAASAEDLKPLSLAIEVFDISDAALQMKPSGVENAVAGLLLTAHNLIALRNRPKVDALETAELKSAQPWLLEMKFLELAISLAERDAQWSD